MLADPPHCSSSHQMMCAQFARIMCAHAHAHARTRSRTHTHTHTLTLMRTHSRNILAHN